MFELEIAQLAKFENIFVTKGSPHWNSYTLGKVGPGDLTNLLISEKVLVNIFDNNLLSSIYYKLDNACNKKNWLSSQMKLYLNCETYVREKIGKNKPIVPVVLQVEGKDIYSAYDGIGINSGLIYDIRTTTVSLDSDMLKNYLVEIIHQFYVLYGDDTDTDGEIAKLIVMDIHNCDFLVCDKKIKSYSIQKLNSEFILCDDDYRVTGFSLTYENWINYCDKYLTIFKQVEETFFKELLQVSNSFYRELTKFTSGKKSEEVSKLIFLANQYGGSTGLIEEIKAYY